MIFFFFFLLLGCWKSENNEDLEFFFPNTNDWYNIVGICVLQPPMKVTLAVQSWGPAHACLSCQMETWLGKGERMCESISQTYGAALGGKWGLGWLEHAHPGGSFCSCLSLHSDLQPWVCVPVSLLWITEVFRDLHWEMVGFFMELRATYWCVRREIPVLSRALLAFLLSPETISLDWSGSVTFWFKLVQICWIASWGAEVCGCKRTWGAPDIWALAANTLLGSFLRWAKKPVFSSFYLYFFFLPGVLAEHAEFVWLEVCIFLTGKQKKWKIEQTDVPSSERITQDRDGK